MINYDNANHYATTMNRIYSSSILQPINAFKRYYYIIPKTNLNRPNICNYYHNNITKRNVTSINAPAVNHANIIHDNNINKTSDSVNKFLWNPTLQSIKLHSQEQSAQYPKSNYLLLCELECELGKGFNNNNNIVEEIELNGWVRSIRHSKNVSFLMLNDGSTSNSLQCVIEKSVINNSPNFDMINTGASVKLIGKLVKLEQKQNKVDTSNIVDNPLSKHELIVSSIDLYGESSSNRYPIAKKDHTYEYLREVLHFRYRTQLLNNMLRVRSASLTAIQQFFNNNKFIQITAPVLTPLDCEGAGETFSVISNSKPNFFGRPIYLSVSGQLYAELVVHSISRVYSISQIFRAESHNTARHLSEFTMIEPECAFADLQDIIELSQLLIKYVIQYVLNNCKHELITFQSKNEANLINKLNNILNEPFKQMTYTEAITILMEIQNKNKVKFEFPIHNWGDSLQSEHEKYLCEVYTNNTPLFITHYPANIKPFYMKQTSNNINNNQITVNCFDLLFPQIGELIGGSERENNYDILINKMKDGGLDMNLYSWYSELRLYGSIPHAGFGLGFERLLKVMTGFTNIRELVTVPRAANQANI